MNEDKRLEEIKRKKASDPDTAYLLSIIERLEKKNTVLTAQNMELSQEIENVKSDFGGTR